MRPGSTFFLPGTRGAEIHESVRPLGAERETVEAQLALFPNVRFVRRLADTREIYARTRILLVPSVVEEGGPRVIREAQLNRIPVLGSARGGVPEMVGDGGLIIADYEDAGAWAAAISSGGSRRTPW